VKIKLLVGSVVSFIGLAIALPAFTATITINDASCASFTTSGTASNLTLTCGAAPPPPVNATTCNAITATATTINEGGSSTLTANCPDATSYSWLPGGSTARSIAVAPTMGTTYTVTASNTLPSSDTASVTVNVTPAAAPPSCSPSASPASITSGQSTQLNAGCTGATGYAWTSSPASSISGISAPTVPPTVNTTYTLEATNSKGTGGGTVTVTVTEPVVTNFSCGAGLTVNNVSVQTQYNQSGDAYSVRMGEGEAYAMSFTTGPATSQIQTIDIVEWSGSVALRDVTLSEAACNYTSTADARVVSEKPNITFTVGVTVSKSFIRPDLVYPMLKPRTLYHVNLRNRHPISGASTCSGSCGFNFKFFGSVP
jgi:trimeric autotransporter adhesin